MPYLSARTVAALALCNIVNHGRSTETAFKRMLVPLSSQDQSWAKLLVMGVCRHFFSLNLLLNHLLDKPFKQKDNDARAALHCALYQILHLDTQAHAAVSECLHTLDQLDKGWAKPFANAVLRRLLREQDSLVQAVCDSDEYQFDHPKWLIKRIRGAWGREGEAAMRAALTHPPMTLRVNLKQGSRAEYLAQLQQADISATPCQYSQAGIQLAAATDVSALPGFWQGQVSVQDEAAQLAAWLLDPQPHDRILDACSAPGGKTGHLLERTSNAEVVAIDVDANRLQRVAENLQRLGLNAQLQTAHVERLDDWWDGQAFDRILLDAPCSATGVIRRHPDIKLLRKPTDIAALVVLQSQMLDALWRALKPGGRMLYATCSILSQENAEQLAAFLARQTDARAIPIDLACGKSVGVGHQLLPQPNGHDGFYYALLEKHHCLKPNV